MKTKNLALTALLMLSSLAASAQPITIQVKGMVCSFCAQGIEKKFKSMSEVKTISVNMETKLVSLDTKDGQDISDEKLKSTITDSGYEVVKVERSK